jgi:hypothetical protein
MKRFRKKVILKQLREDMKEFLNRKLSPNKVGKKLWIWDLIK